MATVSNVNFSLVITDNPYATEAAKNATYYYNTQGDATAEYFLTANIGTVTASNGFANVNLTANLDALGPSESKAFSIIIRKNSHTGPVIATSNTINIIGEDTLFHQATGGNTSVSGGYKIHEFSSSGNLIVSSVAVPFNNQVDYLVVGGGGGGGGGGRGGGGGAGGMLIGTESSSIITQTGNLLVIVGAGGTAGTSGANSALGSSLLAIGGGFGAQALPSPAQRGGDGGSGGGGGYNQSPLVTSPVSFGFGIPGQGNPGGMFNPANRNSGGGGGAGGVGAPSPPPNGPGGPGGIGLPVTWATPFIGTTGPTPGRWFAGGGGGAGLSGSPPGGTGGAGGGGAGGAVGTSKTGGGGGGGPFSSGFQGGSGAIAIRYPFKPAPTYTIETPAVIISNSNIIFSVNTTGLTANARYFYTLAGNAEVIQSNAGSFIVSNNSARIIFSLSEYNQEGREIGFNMRRLSTTGKILANTSLIPIANAETAYTVATGGTEFTVTDNDIDYKVHVFTSSGILNVTKVGEIFNNMDYVVIGGGGGGGDLQLPPSSKTGSGGGAGGVLQGNISVSSTSYAMVVGAGGIGSILTSGGSNGSNSGAFSNVVIAVGGGGAGWPATLSGSRSGSAPEFRGRAGGSGGGTSWIGLYGGDGISGQGHPGGQFQPLGTFPAPGAGGPFGNYGAGGGGAGQAGGNVIIPSGVIGYGGNGIPISWLTPEYGTPGPDEGRWFGGGGGGASVPGNGAAGGFGGGGPGLGFAGNVNTGGGGGAASPSSSWPQPAPAQPAYRAGAPGGSGIVVVRYRT